MSEITSETLLRRDPKQIFSSVDGEIVMLSVDEGKYYGLNKVASTIWELIDNPIDVNSIIEELRNIFDVPYEQCFTETMDCIQDMHKKKLVIVC